MGLLQNLRQKRKVLARDGKSLFAVRGGKFLTINSDYADLANFEGEFLGETETSLTPQKAHITLEQATILQGEENCVPMPEAGSNFVPVPEGEENFVPEQEGEENLVAVEEGEEDFVSLPEQTHRNLSLLEKTHHTLSLGSDPEDETGEGAQQPQQDGEENFAHGQRGTETRTTVEKVGASNRSCDVSAMPD